MTPAEFTILLAACGLNDQQAAALFGVRDRTLRYWREGRRLQPPADAAETLARLDAELDRIAARAVETASTIVASIAAGAPREILLLAYRSDDDLARYRPEDAKRLGWTSVHRALLDRTRRALERAGYPTRIVWLDPDDYEAWRKAERRRDGEDARAAWAALRLDQPAA